MFWLFTSTVLAGVPFDSDRLLNIIEAGSALRTHQVLDRSPSIPKQSYLEAASSEISTGLQPVSGHSAQIGWAVGIFAVPIEHLYASINEELKHTELNGLSHTELLEGDPCTDQRKVLMILPLPMISDRWWITTQHTNPALRRHSNGQMAELAWTADITSTVASLSAANQQRVRNKVRIRFTQGRWLLIKLDEQHTLGEYHSWVDPGGRIPAGPASHFTNRSLAEVFTAMESYALSSPISGCKGLP